METGFALGVGNWLCFGVEKIIMEIGELATAAFMLNEITQTRPFGLPSLFQ